MVRGNNTRSVLAMIASLAVILAFTFAVLDRWYLSKSEAAEKYYRRDDQTIAVLDMNRRLDRIESNQMELLKEMRGW